MVIISVVDEVYGGNWSIPSMNEASWELRLSKVASVSVSTNWNWLKDVSEDTHMGQYDPTI